MRVRKEKVNNRPGSRQPAQSGVEGSILPAREGDPSQGVVRAQRALGSPGPALNEKFLGI